MLPIDDELLPVSVTDDDGADKVVTIVGDCLPLVTFFVTLKELLRQIFEKLDHLLRLPLVLALIVVDRVFRGSEQLSDRLRVSPNLFHSTTSARFEPVISASIRTMSFSISRMSASISSSGRGGV